MYVHTGINGSSKLLRTPFFFPGLQLSSRITTIGVMSDSPTKRKRRGELKSRIKYSHCHVEVKEYFAFHTYLF